MFLQPMGTGKGTFIRIVISAVGGWILGDCLGGCVGSILASILVGLGIMWYEIWHYKKQTEREEERMQMVETVANQLNRLIERLDAKVMTPYDLCNSTDRIAEFYGQFVYVARLLEEVKNVSVDNQDKYAMQKELFCGIIAEIEQDFLKGITGGPLFEESSAYCGSEDEWILPHCSESDSYALESFSNLKNEDLSQRYTIEGLLGVGRFWSAYVVKDIRDNQRYVLKRLENDMSQSMKQHAPTKRKYEKIKAMKEKESRILRSFQNPSDSANHVVIQYVDEGTYCSSEPSSLVERYALITEYFSDTTLDRLKKQTPLEDKLYLLYIIAHGLRSLHQSVLHLDLKPQNILIKQDSHAWHLRFIDFGYSQEALLGQSVDIREQIGTDRYKAPEVISRRNITDRADVYSVGKIAEIDMLDGEKKNYKELIEQATALNPTQRPSAQDLAEQYREIIIVYPG